MLADGFQGLDLIENVYHSVSPLNIIKFILTVIPPSNDRMPIATVPVCRDQEPQKLSSWHIFLNCWKATKRVYLMKNAKEPLDDFYIF